MNPKLMHRMLWKDLRESTSLGVGVLLAIVAFFALLWLAEDAAGLAAERMSLAYAIWGLMPMLVAFGAPAVLLGGEEENGTLAWLKSLPASWSTIAISKLLAALLWTVAAWALATLCFLSYWAWQSDAILDRVRQVQALPEPFGWHWAGWSLLSLVTLLISFTTAYGFRSPITALLMVAPLLIAVTWLLLGVWMLLYGGRPSWRALQSAGALLTSGGLVLVLLIAWFAALMVTAYWRLARPEGAWLDGGGSAIPNAFRPPRSVVRSLLDETPQLRRPSKIAALWWQQWFPIRWFVSLALVAGVLGAILVATETASGVGAGLALASVALMLLGALTFYSDSIRDRCVFFDDRGISPGWVWFTRLLPTGAAALAVILAVALAAARNATPLWEALPLVLVAAGLTIFAIAVLVSQWSPRPTLAFFAVPVVTHLAAFVLGPLGVRFPNGLSVLLVSAAVLLAASGWLTPVWLAAKTRQRAYVLPFLSFLAVSLILPYVIVLAARWATMPPEQPELRRLLTAASLPQADRQREPIAILPSASMRSLETLALSDPLTPLITARPGLPTTLERRIQRALEEKNAIGQHVSFQELLHVLCRTRVENIARRWEMSRSRPTVHIDAMIHPNADRFATVHRWQLDAVAILLDWSRLVRQHAVWGQADFQTVLSVAEPADWLASLWLDAAVSAGVADDEVGVLLERLPAKSLVDRSRGFALVRNWRRYQSVGGRFATRIPRPPSSWWLAVERERTGRAIDVLTGMMLTRIANSQPFDEDAFVQRVAELERMAYLEADSPVTPAFEAPALTERLELMGQTDRRLAALRDSIEETLEP